jgi:hypothetical protein
MPSPVFFCMSSMSHSLLLIFALLISGCQKVQEEPLLRASEYLPLIRGDDYWLTLAQLDLVDQLYRNKNTDKAGALLNVIMGYRRAIGTLRGVEALVRFGYFDQACGQLSKMGSLPQEGAAQQKWEIIANLISLAEAAGCREQVVTAITRAGVDVPPMFQDLGNKSFMSSGSKNSSVDPSSKGGLKTSPFKPIPLSKSESSEKSESSNRIKSSNEASEGGEKLQARMMIASGGRALILRAEGLLARGEAGEARKLLTPVVSEGVDYRFANVGDLADLFRLAHAAGLEKEVNQKEDSLVRATRAQAPALTTAYKYWGKMIHLLGVIEKKELAGTLAHEAEERIHATLPDFFQAQALAELGTGVYLAGLHLEARDLWIKALQIAEKIPNPRSRAWGAFQVLIAEARAGATILPQEEIFIGRIEKALPSAYARIGQ